MRKDCIVAIRKWIKLAPKKFMEIQTIKCVLRAITEDLNRSVRLEAMYILMEIFNMEKCKIFTVIHTIIDEITLCVGQATKDKYVKVRVLAVDVLAAIDKYTIKVIHIGRIF